MLLQRMMLLVFCTGICGLVQVHSQDFPIPQNSNLLAQQRNERRAWFKQAMLDAYEKSGKHDPKWDESVRNGIDAAVDSLAIKTQANTEVQAKRVLVELKKAIDAGCDDPYVHYLYLQKIRGDQANSNDGKDFLQACIALGESNYSAQRRMHAWQNAAASVSQLIQRRTFGTSRQPEVVQNLEKALAAMADALKDNNRYAREDVYHICRLMRATIKSNQLNEAEWMAKIKQVLKQAPRGEAMQLLFTGRCLIDDAWQARGSGTSDNVTEQGFQQFSALLTKAEQALEQAWQADPTMAEIANQMLSVCMGLGRDRKQYELWFKRAVELDGDNHAACSSKMLYLHPKWHGSVEELLDFGTQCIATGNWQGGLTVIGMQTRFDHARMMKGQADPLKHPDVWKEVQQVFDPLVQAYPESAWVRTSYLRWAHYCGQRQAALKQNHALGGKLARAPFLSEKEYQDFVRYYSDPAILAESAKPQ